MLMLAAGCWQMALENMELTYIFSTREIADSPIHDP